MPKPLVMTISHELGKEEAKRRLQNGVGQMRAQLAPFTTSLDHQWVEDRLSFYMVAIGQRIAGHQRHVGFDIQPGKVGLQAEVLGLGDRVCLVVVAAGALHREAEECVSRGGESFIALLVIALGDAINSYWASALIVGVILLLAAVVLARQGMAGAERAKEGLQRTAESVGDDARWGKEEVRTFKRELTA